MESDSTAFALTGMNGAVPNFKNIVLGKINTFRPLFLVFHKKTDNKIQTFISWLCPMKGRKLLRTKVRINDRKYSDKNQ